MHFGQPDNLYLLVLLAPMIAALMGYYWWKRRLRERLGHPRLIRAMAARHSNRRQLSRAVMVVCAAALLCVAAARPQWGQNDRTIKRYGVDLVFALDLSSSMLAKDLPPSRLQAAKNEINTTLKTLGGDRVGLVVFTAISFAQSPLTSDYGAIRFYLDKLQAGQMPVGGTSVGQAILDSVKLLIGHKVDADQPAKHQDVKRAKNQVVVLITDGEDHESSPVAAAKEARDHGIRVVTVGVGSPQGSRIPIYSDSGRLKGYKRTQKGELVRSKLDEDTLKQIAEESGGTYLRYTGKNSIVNGLNDYIDRLEKSELETMLRKRYKDRFMYFVAPALLLLLAAMLLGERRGKPHGAPGRADDGGRPRLGGASAMMLLLIGLLIGLSGCDGAFRDTVDEVEQANKLVGQRDYKKALDKYNQAQKEVPATPELFYDRAIGLLGAEKYEEARKSFARALETQTPQLRFDALFNLGLALAGQESWKEAYETYKQALQVELDPQKPANKERIEQARHNLEVVFRKLFPPCSKLEDDLEENDAPKSASQLKKLSKDDLALCGGDADWFVIPAIVGTSVSVDANFSVLRDEPDPEHVFLPRPQDLQIAVFDASGTDVVAVDQGAQKHFDSDAASAARTIKTFKVTPEMVAAGQSTGSPSGDQPQRLLLKVSAADKREFSYDLDVTAIPPCPALEDDYEENDTPETAKTLDTLDKSNPKARLHMCPGDDDWYKVALKMGDTLFVDVKAAKDRERGRRPSLAVDIIRADSGRVVAKGRRDGAFMTGGVRDVAEPGTFLVHVRGQTDDEQGPYTTDLYKYAPCVAGNDRYEDNDTAQQAASFDTQKPVHRYLRLCDGDRDFFSLPAPNKSPKGASGGSKSSGDDKKAKVAWGLTAIDDPRPADSTGARGQSGDGDSVALDLMSASGDRVVAEGAAPKVASPRAPTAAPPSSAAGRTPGPHPTDGARPVARRLDQVVHAPNKDKADLLLRVRGPQTFYHLTQLNPQKRKPQNKQNNKKNDDKNNKNKDDQNKKDKKKSPDDKQNDSTNKSDAKKKDDNKKSSESPGQKKKDKDDKKDKKQSTRGKPKKVDPKKRRTDDILRSLEETDKNFQMKKALEDMPNRYIEKDW